MRAVVPTPSRRVIVLAGGEFVPSVLDGIETRDAGVVCVDRGLAHCLEAGLVPTLLVGDFDSVPPDLLARDDHTELPRLAFPADKDASDLELALRALAGEMAMPATLAAPDEVVLVAVSGGRTDHMLFNWQLVGARRWPFRLRLLDPSVDAVLVTPEQPLSRPSPDPGGTVSLLPLGLVRGVTTAGLRYALAGATLPPGGTLGLSNVSDGDELIVTIESGAVLVMCVSRESR